MNSRCDECRALWNEYASALTTHIQLDNKLKLATLEGDHRKAQSLQPRLEEAGAKRVLVRGIIREHDLLVHGEAAAVAG